MKLGEAGSDLPDLDGADCCNPLQPAVPPTGRDNHGGVNDGVWERGADAGSSGLLTACSASASCSSMAQPRMGIAARLDDVDLSHSLKIAFRRASPVFILLSF
jgi:hypothetical protein